MFTQTVMQNLGALKVGWYWLLTLLVRAGARKRKHEK